jgi:hypothetical protein
MLRVGYRTGIYSAVKTYEVFYKKRLLLSCSNLKSMFEQIETMKKLMQ